MHPDRRLHDQPPTAARFLLQQGQSLKITVRLFSRLRSDESSPQLPDGSFQMQFSTDPHKAVPHLDVNADTGNFTYAVYQMPPGSTTWPPAQTAVGPSSSRSGASTRVLLATYKQVTP